MSSKVSGKARSREKEMAWTEWQQYNDQGVWYRSRYNRKGEPRYQYYDETTRQTTGDDIEYVDETVPRQVGVEDMSLEMQNLHMGDNGSPSYKVSSSKGKGKEKEKDKGKEKEKDKGKEKERDKGREKERGKDGEKARRRGKEKKGKGKEKDSEPLDPFYGVMPSYFPNDEPPPASDQDLPEGEIYDLPPEPDSPQGSTIAQPSVSSYVQEPQDSDTESTSTRIAASSTNYIGRGGYPSSSNTSYTTGFGDEETDNEDLREAIRQSRAESFPMRHVGGESSQTGPASGYSQGHSSASTYSEQAEPQGATHQTWEESFPTHHGPGESHRSGSTSRYGQGKSSASMYNEEAEVEEAEVEEAELEEAEFEEAEFEEAELQEAMRRSREESFPTHHGTGESYQSGSTPGYGQGQSSASMYSEGGDHQEAMRQSRGESFPAHHGAGDSSRSGPRYGHGQPPTSGRTRPAEYARHGSSGSAEPGEYVGYTSTSAYGPVAQAQYSGYSAGPSMSAQGSAGQGSFPGYGGAAPSAGRWDDITGYQGGAPQYPMSQTSGYVVDEGQVTPRAGSPMHEETVIGTGGGEFEALDPNYQVQPSWRFQPGEVFKVLWSEPKGATGIPDEASDVQSFKDALGQSFYTGIRRFLIIATDAGHSTCVPIFTYGRLGCRKHGLKPDRHGIIFSGDRGKVKLLHGEPKLGFPPVKMRVYAEHEKLAKESRINYAQYVSVQHNVKVFFIGAVEGEDLELVTDAADACWSKKQRHRKKKR